MTNHERVVDLLKAILFVSIVCLALALTDSVLLLNVLQKL
jgi:hypothetical protein